MAGWHHQPNGHWFERTPGVGDGQGGLACCDSWGRKESDTTEWLSRTELKALMELPRWLSGKEYASNAGDEGSMPGLEAPLEKEMATHSSSLD